MTLIAAYRPYGVPILFGDFLISGGVVKYANKKIYKISPNFVIGWTGRKIDASSILRRLFKEFEDKIVSIREVEKFLTRIPPDKYFREELHLIGWIVEDNNPICFLWNIQYPQELFYAPYHTDGSGSEKFNELMKQDVAGSPLESAETTIQQAIYSVLTKATQLYADEATQKLNQSRGFGHGYELLYFNGTEFNYLENIAFGGADVIWNVDEDKGQSFPYKFWYIFKTLATYSHLLIYNLQNGNMVSDLIYPIVEGKSQDAKIEWVAGSPRADYYSLYFRIQTNTNEYYEVSVVLPEVKVGPSKYVKFINGGYAFVYGEELLRRLYEQSKFQKEYYKTKSIPIGWGAAEADEKITKPNSRFVFQAGQTDKTLISGFIKDEEWDQNYKTIDYAIMCGRDETIKLYEKGNVVGPFGIKYINEDFFILEITEEKGEMKVNYLQNNFLLYQSSIEPVLPLKVVVSLREEGTEIKNCRIISLD